MNRSLGQSLEAELRDIIVLGPDVFTIQDYIHSHYYLTVYIHLIREMTSFTDGKNDELLAFQKYLTDHPVLPVQSLKTSLKILCAPAIHKKSPLKTAEEAISVHDMFAFFLSSGEPGYVIAVSGGFVADGSYHIVGAGNAGRKGVRRPSKGLCDALAGACTNFISASTNPPDPDDISGVLVAALNICSAEVARRLKPVNKGKNPDPTTQYASYIRLLQRLGLPHHEAFCAGVAVLREHLKWWKELQPVEKAMVATLYGLCLETAYDLCDKIKDFESAQLEPHEGFIREFSNIAKGLRLLRRFPSDTRVVFGWPQGLTNRDRFRCRPGNAETAPWQTVIEGIISESATRLHVKLRKKMQKKWKAAIEENEWGDAVRHNECQIHCEVYLALHILFSNSKVKFCSFSVERERFVPIGCSKASCIACWDILLELSRQDSSGDLMCRTRRSHGKCYETWGLTPQIERLPPSLARDITGPRRTQMVESLNLALRSSHQKFKERVERLMRQTR